MLPHGQRTLTAQMHSHLLRNQCLRPYYLNDCLLLKMPTAEPFAAGNVVHASVHFHVASLVAILTNHAILEYSSGSGTFAEGCRSRRDF
jgi:hypothetical protein